MKVGLVKQAKAHAGESHNPELNVRRVGSWARNVLVLAGVYNLVWGAWVVLFPQHVFQLFQLQIPLYPQIWQCVGMIVGVYGVGYLVAAFDPYRHWPIILVGLLGKVLGTIGFIQSAANGELPWSWGFLCLYNDLIWWAPFSLILLRAWKHATSKLAAANQDTSASPIELPSL
jgi:small multidrug resistance pump